MNLPATKPACTLAALLLPWGCALLLALLWLSGVDLGAWVDKLSPGCLFHRLTGWYCPGCGGTRATVALLHGDCLAAVRYNFFWVPSLFVLLMEYALLWCRHFGKSTPFPRAHARILLGYAWLSVIWFVGRNIIGV